MANPKKFSEKMALHNQKQAEETGAFEKIMKEVMDGTAKKDSHRICKLTSSDDEDLKDGKENPKLRPTSLPNYKAFVGSSKDETITITVTPSVSPAPPPRPQKSKNKGVSLDPAEDKTVTNTPFGSFEPPPPRPPLPPSRAINHFYAIYDGIPEYELGGKLKIDNRASVGSLKDETITTTPTVSPVPSPLPPKFPMQQTSYGYCAIETVSECLINDEIKNFNRTEPKYNNSIVRRNSESESDTQLSAIKNALEKRRQDFDSDNEHELFSELEERDVPIEVYEESYLVPKNVDAGKTKPLKKLWSPFVIFEDFFNLKSVSINNTKLDRSEIVYSFSKCSNLYKLVFDSIEIIGCSKDKAHLPRLSHVEMNLVSQDNNIIEAAQKVEYFTFFYKNVDDWLDIFSINYILVSFNQIVLVEVDEKEKELTFTMKDVVVPTGQLSSVISFPVMKLILHNCKANGIPMGLEHLQLESVKLLEEENDIEEFASEVDITKFITPKMKSLIVNCEDICCTKISVKLESLKSIKIVSLKYCNILYPTK